MSDLKQGDDVRVIGGRYTGWSGTIERIGKTGVATVSINAIPGIDDLDLQPDDYIKAGVRLDKLERIERAEAA